MNTRRTFLRQTLAGSAAISLAGSLPGFLLGASRRANLTNSDNVLVVIQLSGGNDGLNTVIPYGDDAYYENRFTLAIPKSATLKIDDYIGFHPALRGFDRLLQNGQMSIVQGVGYPNPNRSHFESMDLWHTAHRISESEKLGWLGRCVDSVYSQADLPAIHYGEGLQPLALRTENKPIPTIRSIQDFRLNLNRQQESRQLLATVMKRKPGSENTLLGYIHESADVALRMSQRLEDIPESLRGKYGYPGSALGRNMSVIAQLIGSGLKTKIYYTMLDGFDTHSNQAAAHQSLLTDFSDSITAFQQEIADQGNNQRVTVFAFSEFGRRVRENASHGTDHGSAAPVFLFGSALKQRVIGDHPSFQSLDEGDLKFKIDYRRVYADLLKNWLSIDPATILLSDHQAVGLFG